MLRVFKFMLIILFSIIAISCTGGSNEGGDNPSPAPDPQPPIPNNTVTLDDKDGGVVEGIVPNSLNPLIILQFSKPINQNTINANTINLVDTNGEKVAIGNISNSEDNTKFYFSPLSQLKQNTKYNINLLTGILNADGGKFVPTRLSFTTGDFKKPMVGIIKPGNESTNVLLSTFIKLRFSEKVTNLTTDTVSLHEGEINGPKIDTSEITLDANNEVSFIAKLSLKGSTKYYVVLSSQITDVSENNNPLDAKVFSFTTGDFTKPEVDLSVFGDSRKPTLNLQFSEEVQNVNSDNVKLINQNDNTEVAIDISYTDNVHYNIVPKNLLEPGVNYQLQLSDAIADFSNNKLDQKTFTVKGNDIWSLLGASDLGLHDTYNGKITLEPQTQTPYISFQDGHSESSGTGASVMKFDGQNWVYVGNQFISESGSFFVSLAFDKQNQLNLVYRDTAAGPLGNYKASLMKFDGENWGYVGNQGFTQFNANFTSLNFDNDNTPYVSFQDGGLLNDGKAKASVMKFNGESWVYVGTRGFSDGVVQQITSSFNPVNGKLYVAFQDASQAGAGGLTVMVLEENNWNVVGQKSIKPGGQMISNPRFNFDPINGNTYVIFTQGASIKTYGFDVNNQALGDVAINNDFTIAKNGAYYSYVVQESKLQFKISNDIGHNWNNFGAEFDITGKTVIDIKVDNDGQVYALLRDNSIGKLTIIGL